jgi:hypothetical protein
MRGPRVTIGYSVLHGPSVNSSCQQRLAKGLQLLPTESDAQRSQMQLITHQIVPHGLSFDLALAAYL